MVVNLSFDGAVAVTPVASGTVKADVHAPQPGSFAALLVAVAGTVVFTDSLGNVVTLGSLTAGTLIRVKAVNVINTSTATVYGLVAPA